MRYYYNATRGGTAIDWTMASGSEPPLESPDYWEIESDRRQDPPCDEDSCLDDFLTSVEPD